MHTFGATETDFQQRSKLYGRLKLKSVFEFSMAVHPASVTIAFAKGPDCIAD